MNVIYKLPKYCALCVGGLVIYDIYKSIKLANAENFFEIIQYSGGIDNTTFVFMGMDSYTLLICIGAILGIFVGVLRRNIINVNVPIAILIQILFVLQVFAGVKLAYGIENVLTNNSMEAFSLGGQSLYGGLFLSLVCVPIIAKIFKKRARDIFDFVTPLWLIHFSFGKMACYSVGCCGSNPCMVGGTEILLPIQLFEAVWLLIILQLIFHLECKKTKGGECEYGNGIYFFITMAMYGVCRFFTEFIKDTYMFEFGLTINQIFSAVGIIIALIVIRRWKYEANEK